MSNDVRAGGAFVEIYLKDKFRNQLAEYSQRFKSIGNTLSTAFAISAGVGVGALTSFATYADDIADTAGRLGIGAESLQSLGYAASQTGANMSDVEKGLRNVAKLTGQAELGNKAAIKTLQEMGLSYEQLKELSPDKQLELIADRIAGIPDQATQTAVAMKLLGKSGAALIPMLRDGSAGLQAYQEQAKALGLVMRNEDVEAGGKLADTFGTVTQQTRALFNVIGAALAPSFQMLLEAGRGVLAWAINFVDRNRALVVTISTVTAVIGGLAIGAYLVSGAFAVASVAAGVYAAAGTALGSALAFVTAMEYAALAPALLIAAAVIGIGAGALWAMGAFENFGSVFSGTWRGIVDAVSAGDLSMAWEIIVAGMSLAWSTFTTNLQIKWLDAQKAMRTSAAETAAKVAESFGMIEQADALRYMATRANTADGFKQGELSIGLELQNDEFNSLLEKATAARKKLEISGKKSLKPFDMPSLASGVSSDQAFSTGTFSSRVVGLLGNMGQSIQEKQLKAQEDANEHLEAIEEGIENLEPGFSIT